MHAHDFWSRMEVISEVTDYTPYKDIDVNWQTQMLFLGKNRNRDYKEIKRNDRTSKTNVYFYS